MASPAQARFKPASGLGWAGLKRAGLGWALGFGPGPAHHYSLHPIPLRALMSARAPPQPSPLLVARPLSYPSDLPASEPQALFLSLSARSFFFSAFPL